MGGNCAFSVLLDGGYLNKRLRCLQFGKIPSLIATSPTLENYKNVFTSVPLLRYLANTLWFTVATTVLMLVVVTLAAYAFARMRFRGKNIVFGLFIADDDTV